MLRVMVRSWAAQQQQQKKSINVDDNRDETASSAAAAASASASAAAAIRKLSASSMDVLEQLPNTVSVCFKGAKSYELIHMLSSKVRLNGIYRHVSAFKIHLSTSCIKFIFDQLYFPHRFLLTCIVMIPGCMLCWVRVSCCAYSQ